MQSLPDLSQLSHAQKDELIIALFGQVQKLMKRIDGMQKAIDDLQGRLSLNSKNSSKPPSSDGLNKPKPKSLRVGGQRPTGGQKGHPGGTLRQVAKPDTVITHDVPDQCQACQQRLGVAYVGEVRQVFDLPTLKYQVTEHRVMQALCRCGHMHTGQFPSGVNASVQYGPQALAAMVHLNQHQMVPVARTAALMADFFGLGVSDGVVLKACADAKARLTPTVQAIAQALQTAPVVHADETGLRVGKTLHWMHVAATDALTWVGVHAKRGQQAFADLGVLPAYRGILIHDGWAPYRALDCTHGLCNAHHLRELTYVHEQLHQSWAHDMMVLLTHANAQVTQTGLPLTHVQHGHMRYVFDEILAQADIVNPRAQAILGRRGRTKQSKAANLAGRLRLHADDVWRFACDPGVPFTNNLAEQAVRMPKVKQKISGCFRTSEGAYVFCVIRSYLATMQKQGANLYASLVQTFQGSTPQPCFR